MNLIVVEEEEISLEGKEVTFKDVMIAEDLMTSRFLLMLIICSMISAAFTYGSVTHINCENFVILSANGEVEVEEV